MECTELKDRTLWYDGTFTVSSNQVLDFLKKYPSITPYVSDITEDIQQYNKYNSPEITIKDFIKKPEYNWKIPKEYLQLELDIFLHHKLNELNITHSNEKQKRLHRINLELNLFKYHNSLDILRVMIFIVDIFTNNNIVWGVGRGSSVSSYILYLIGIHDVDSVKYDLNIYDFLRA